MKTLFKACLLNVIPLSVCVTRQDWLAGWLAEESGGVRAGDCSPPPLHPSPQMRLETVSGHGKWDTEPLGARLGCVCVCGVEDSSRLLEARPRAAEPLQSAHS